MPLLKPSRRMIRGLIICSNPSLSIIKIDCRWPLYPNKLSKEGRICRVFMGGSDEYKMSQFETEGIWMISNSANFDRFRYFFMISLDFSGLK